METGKTRRDYELEKIAAVNARIEAVLQKTATRLKAANAKRGNAWEGIGVVGLFLEVRTMYLRLRHQIWDEIVVNRPITAADDNFFSEEHLDRVLDTLLDMRAYSVLTELAIMDKNYTGKGDVDTHLL